MAGFKAIPEDGELTSSADRTIGTAHSALILLHTKHRQFKLNAASA
jgi:hypothetical protein